MFLQKIVLLNKRFLSEIAPAAQTCRSVDSCHCHQLQLSHSSRGTSDFQKDKNSPIVCVHLQSAYCQEKLIFMALEFENKFRLPQYKHDMMHVRSLLQQLPDDHEMFVNLSDYYNNIFHVIIISMKKRLIIQYTTKILLLLVHKQIS